MHRRTSISNRVLLGGVLAFAAGACSPGTLTEGQGGAGGAAGGGAAGGAAGGGETGATGGDAGTGGTSGTAGTGGAAATSGAGGDAGSGGTGGSAATGGTGGDAGSGGTGGSAATGGTGGDAGSGGTGGSAATGGTGGAAGSGGTGGGAGTSGSGGTGGSAATGGTGGDAGSGGSGGGALLHSDTFTDISQLSAPWRFDDPLTDCELSFDGANAILSLPQGDHSNWKPIKAPSLLQAAPTGDFSIEVGFDSFPTADYNGQGIVVRESKSLFLTVESYHIGGEFKTMIARLDGTEQAIYKSAAVAPAQYMRLARVGDDWTVWFSADGDAWTEIAAFQPGLAPTEMGVFGSNTGSAFDAKVDYFIDLSDPLEDTDTAP